MTQKGSPEFVVPDAIEQVVGWKAWSVLRGGVLASPRFLQRWEVREETTARCIRKPERLLHYDLAPSKACRCGIYIARTAFTAAQYGSVLGQVAGWGKVVEHEYGWRVQCAYPLEIYIGKGALDSLDKMPQKLQENYGIPVRVVSPEEMHRLTRASDEEIILRWREWVKQRPEFSSIRFEEK